MLALLAAIGGACLALPTTHAAPVGSPAVEAERDSVQLRGNPLWGIPLTSLTATTERPMFSPSRRRPIPPAPPPVAAPPPPPEPVAAAPEQIPLKLLGTITNPKGGIAICFILATNEVVRLRTGESHDGWILRGVHAREAVFEKGTERTTLALPSADDPQVASAPPPPPPMTGRQDPSTYSSMNPPQPPANMAQPQSGFPAAPPSGTWRDGDGNLIAPPPRAR